jgi:hypothetical protein
VKDNASNFAPPIHKRGIVVKVGDETLVYQKENHKAHCLNSTAAEVWKLCDGTKTVAEIAAVMSKESQSPVGEELVWLTLRRLSKSGLLVKKKKDAQVLASRRAAMCKIGAAALALPLVTSILVPTASAAASCSGFGGQCRTLPCCSPFVCDTLSHLCV